MPPQYLSNTFDASLAYQHKDDNTNLRSRFIPLLLLALFLTELGAFIFVASLIGVLAAIGLALATSILGGILLRVQGLGTIGRIQRVMDQGGSPGRELVHGLMIVLAGMLLIVPGFVSDLLGLLLFIAPIRDGVWSFLKSRISIVTTPFSGRTERTIDLDAADFHSQPDSPWRRLDDK